MTGQAWRNVGELDCHGVTVQLDEDGDVQDDGTVLWSGCAHGFCEVCGQSYVDWWEGTFALGEPTGSHTDRLEGDR